MDTNHSDLIQHLLDGELDSMYDQTLFSELAANSDLRSELKQQLALRNEVANDRMALIPPASLTGAVFTGLGMSAPMMGAAAGAAGGFMASMIARVGVPVISAALATGITWGVLQSTSASSPTPVVQTSTQHVNNAAIAAPVQHAAPRERVSVRRDDGEPRYTKAEYERLFGAPQPVVAQRTTPPSTVPPSSTKVEQSETPVPVPTMRSSDVSSVRVSNAIDLSRSDEPRALQASQIQNTIAAWDAYPAFSLQARGFALVPTVQTSADAQTEWYQNLGLAFMYQLSDHHSFGLEFGSEVFPQVFEGTRSNGQVVRYEQQPSSMWATAVYRYSFDGIGATAFRPFMQGSLGGTKYGPLGRAIVGMQYAPLGPLTFVLGIEGSTMGYQYQNSWFTSSKIGLTYGMAVRF